MQAYYYLLLTTTFTQYTNFHSSSMLFLFFFCTFKLVHPGGHHPQLQLLCSPCRELQLQIERLQASTMNNSGVGLHGHHQEQRNMKSSPCRNGFSQWCVIVEIVKPPGRILNVS